MTDWRGGLHRRFNLWRLRYEWGRWCYTTDSSGQTMSRSWERFSAPAGTPKLDSSKKLEDDQEIPPERRAAILAALGIGAAAAVAVNPKEAQADLSMSEVTGAINNADITSILGTVNVNLDVPSTGMDLIRCLFGGINFNFNFNVCSALGALINGKWSMASTTNVQATMEELWSSDPPGSASGMDEHTTMQYEASFAQVEQSQLATATLAEGQVQLGMEDTATIAALHVAAEEGYMLAVLALMGQLQYTNNLRLGQVIQSLNASQQTRGAQLMATHHPRVLDVETRERQRAPTNTTVGGANRL